MRQFLHLFRIRRDERSLALTLLLLVVGVNVLIVSHYWPLFSVWHRGAFGVFPSHFHVSGFDALIYSIGSQWGGFFTLVYRHPLLSLLLLPTWAITQMLYLLTGRNCVQIVFGVQEMAAAVYALLFLYRILRYVVRIDRRAARALTLLMLSFGMVWVSTAVPDHFIFSLFLILLTLLTGGMLMRQRRPMPTAVTAMQLFLTSGVTLTNGAKTLLAQFFANGRHFFRPRNLLGAALVPPLLLLAIGKAEYKLVVQPGEKARTEARLRKQKAREAARRANLTVKPQPSVQPAGSGHGTASQHRKATPRPILAQWIDTTTPRWPSLRDNFFGETIQLHDAHLLEDAGMRRPVFVAYSHWWNTAVEALVVLLLAAGIIAGRRSRFLWLCLCCVLTDVVIYFGFGFGLNEVYIMACHWVYIVPIAIACLFRALRRRRAASRLLLGLVSLLTLYLFVWNGHLLLRYFS